MAVLSILCCHDGQGSRDREGIGQRRPDPVEAEKMTNPPPVLLLVHLYTVLKRGCDHDLVAYLW